MLHYVNITSLLLLTKNNDDYYSNCDGDCGRLFHCNYDRLTSMLIKTSMKKVMTLHSSRLLLVIVEIIVVVFNQFCSGCCHSDND